MTSAVREWRAEILTVVVTGDTLAGNRAEQLGATGYLAKPFGATALLDLIAKLTPAPAH